MSRWRFVSLVLTALAMGAPIGHALEMPVRRTYDAALYVIVTHTLYLYFGTVGAVIEVAAVACAVGLAVQAWRRGRVSPAARGWITAGAGLLVVAFAAWWVFVYPMNRELATWTPQAVPPDWTRVRDQWEWAHTGRAGLFIAAFCCLLRSVFVELPGRLPEPEVPGKEFREQEIARPS